MPTGNQAFPQEIHWTNLKSTSSHKETKDALEQQQEKIPKKE